MATLKYTFKFTLQGGVITYERLPEQNIYLVDRFLGRLQQMGYLTQAEFQYCEDRIISCIDSPLNWNVYFACVKNNKIKIAMKIDRVNG